MKNLGISLRYFWRERLLEETLHGLAEDVRIGLRARCEFDPADGLSDPEFKLVTREGDRSVLHVPAAARAWATCGDQLLPLPAGPHRLSPEDRVTVELGQTRVEISFQPMPGRVRRALGKKVSPLLTVPLGAGAVAMAALTMYLPTLPKGPLPADEDDLRERYVRFARPTKNALLDKLAEAEGEAAERHKGGEGMMGKMGVAENKTNRSAPKAIDIHARDLLRSSGARDVGGAGVGAKGATGSAFGTSLGDVSGIGGLGLRGTGTGGAGTADVGAIGTKGRGGGLSGYGTGSVGYDGDSREDGKRGYAKMIAELKVNDDFRHAATPLKAAKTDDNAEFDRFLAFLAPWSDRNDVVGKTDLVDVRDRRFVRVLDAAGKPIPTATVQVRNLAQQTTWTGTTFGDGRTAVYPRALLMGRPGAEYVVEASFGDMTRTATWDGQRDLDLTFDADRTIRGAVQLDVVFAIDTTGSMGDEIDRIKGTLVDVTRRLRSGGRQLDLRYGAVLFRDRGDKYVTREMPFTSDLVGFAEALQSVDASGGGDEPEAVNEALAAAVDAPWRTGAAKVVFLIGDAPPHMDYAGDVGYGQTMRRALAKGVRIHSIAASGLNALGTLVWRQVAQFTRGKFIFIEYGSAAATARSHGVAGNYDAGNNLDEIVYEQIREEVRFWGKEEPRPKVAQLQAAPDRGDDAGPVQLRPRRP